MRRRSNVIFVMCTALLCASCGYVFPMKQMEPSFGKASALTVKPVNGKREPNYLISIDGTECSVSKKRFDKVKIGDNQLCLWSAPR